MLKAVRAVVFTPFFTPSWGVNYCAAGVHPLCIHLTKKAMMESDFLLFLSLEEWPVASVCPCAFPHHLIWSQGCRFRWHWGSGCQRRSLTTWKTCETWHQDPREHVERVRCWWLPRCCCVPGLWVRENTLLGMCSVVCLVISAAVPAFIPGSGDVSPPSSPPELKKTSKVSWSEMSISSIWSSKSTFTSMEEMLPIGAAVEGKYWDITSICTACVWIYKHSKSPTHVFCSLG